MAPHSSASHRPVAVRQTMPYGMVTLLDSGEAVPHRLTREETMVCIEGRAFASLSGEIFEMTPGSAIVIPPDTEFSIRNPHATPRHAMPCHSGPLPCSQSADRRPSPASSRSPHRGQAEEVLGRLALVGQCLWSSACCRPTAVGRERPVSGRPQEFDRVSRWHFAMSVF